MASPIRVNPDLLKRAGNPRAAEEAALFEKIWSTSTRVSDYVSSAFFKIGKSILPSFDFTESQQKLLEESIRLNWLRFDHLMRIIKPQRGQVIVDVGCGYGGLVFQMANHGASVLGFDRNPIFIGWGQSVARQFGLRIDTGVADATALPVTSCSADKIVCVNVFEHLPQKEEAVNEFRRVLKPGGSVYIYTDNLINVRLRVKARRLQELVKGHPKAWRVGFSGEEGGHVALISPWNLSVLLRQCGFITQTVYSVPQLPIFGHFFSRFFCGIGRKPL